MDPSALLTTMNTINVLCIDGGGIRGLIPTTILEHLENRLGRRLYEVFDLIAGTSTGGIIALGVGAGAKRGEPFTPAELTQFYVEHGPAIFAKTWYTPIKKWLRPKYSPQPLERVLKTYFEQTELAAALTPLLISSYDLHSQLPFFFKSHMIACDPTYNWKLTEVARATSAAPTFFPPIKLSEAGAQYALVDGGVFVNNPAMASYAEASRLYRQANRFVIVSVGTGDRYDRLNYGHARRWGLLGWAKQIVPVMMDSVNEAVDYELNWIAEPNSNRKYYRLQPKLTGVSNDMDDVSSANINGLRTLAERYIRENAAVLNEICGELKGGRGSNMPGIGLARPDGP
jgi:patatin-like phospholipase/acyl hydrolase